MKTFVTSEIIEFLQCLDSHLTRPFTMIIIGGAAAALAYKAVDYTRDIDTMNDVEAIKDAYRKTKVQTGLDIPLAAAGVADAPYNYEERLKKLKIKGLKKLSVLVPEKHDLCLMKIVRGYEHDMTTVQEINKKIGLDLKTLVLRFNSEMSHVMGSTARIRQNFLAAIERCFGEKSAEKIKNESN